MKRVIFPLLTVSGLVAAGLLAAVVLAAGTPPPATTTTTTTGTTAAATIASGVTIAGVAVAGLAPEAALAAVTRAFGAPLELVIGNTRVLVTPDVLDAAAGTQKAVDRALLAAAGTNVPLGIATDARQTAVFVAGLARRYDRDAADTRLFLRHGRPWLSRERAGLRLDQRRAVRDVLAALSPAARETIVLVQRKLKPKLTRRGFGSVLVIHRGQNRLFLYRGTKYQRVFGVATGQSAYPTPLGRFAIAVKWKNPWWYPPDSPWAKGQKPIPPGLGNPLGTRWMGLTSPGVGIHGTPDAASIGYSASHGCIRMRISEAEWLFNHIDVGTTVFILPH